MENKLSKDDIVNLHEIPLAEMLECPIDGMISLTPVLCKKCETVFCNDCITSWMKRSSECPMRCKPMETIAFDKTILKQQIDLIRLRCTYENFGCKENVLYREMKNHDKICLYIPISCEKCAKEIPSISYLAHLFESCQKYQLRCIYCSNNYNLRNYTIHLKDCFIKNISSFCKICLKVHISKDDHCLKVESCGKCKMPDLKSDIVKNIHICVLNETAEKFNIYLRNLYNKVSLAKKEVTKDLISISETIYKRFIEMTTEIKKKLNEKFLALETNKNLIHEKNLGKFIEAKKKKKDNILSLEKDCEEIQRNNTCKYK